jgi:hypothetical protein
MLSAADESNKARPERVAVVGQRGGRRENSVAVAYLPVRTVCRTDSHTQQRSSDRQTTKRPGDERSDDISEDLAVRITMKQRTPSVLFVFSCYLPAPQTREVVARISRQDARSTIVLPRNQESL